MVMIFVAATKQVPEAGSQQERDAAAVGTLVAELGCDLLTGGGPGAMALVANSFCSTPLRLGRSIGILPADTEVDFGSQELGTVSPFSIAPKRGYPNPWIEIPIRTHLPGNSPKSSSSRNLLNAASGDVSIFLAGSNGTQAELELVLGLKEKAFAFLGADQKIGQYEVKSLPSGVIVKDRIEDLRDAIAEEIRKFALSRPTFSSLKGNYTTDPNGVHPCTMHFPNTCAIRMSEALVKTNNDFHEKFAQSGLNLCPHGFMRGAQDLAGVLRKPDVLGTYDAGFNRPGSPPPNLSGKAGIVAYMKIPDFDGQGHIDLWDGAAPVGSAYWSAETVWFWKLP